MSLERQITVGVPKESQSGERRVALVPDHIPSLVDKNVSIFLETGAGESSGYPDSSYVQKGAKIAPGASTLFSVSDVILKVAPPKTSEASILKEGASTISFLYPLSNLEAVSILVSRKASSFAMELMPRISRAQSMDALSSQATVSGYKAVLIASDNLPKFFPMLMTAAGTIPPARVFVIGAGVAGLQAIATARRLGGVVEAYDVRPAVKEQVASLGAKFVELPVETKDAQTAGGYAKAQSEEFYKRQQELLAEHAGASDVVITTALVPGQRAPILVSEEAVRKMKRGSVIVDLAAEQGGNCALTEPGKIIEKNGVKIIGLLNLPSMMPTQASLLYSRNITSFLNALLKERAEHGTPFLGGKINTKDELVRGPLVIQNGEVVHEPTKKSLLSFRSTTAP